MQSPSPSPPPGTALGRGPTSPDDIRRVQAVISQSISNSLEPSDRLIAQEAEAKLVRFLLPSPPSPT